MNNPKKPHYSHCQIKFAFDVSIESPLSWAEYFGYDDAFDMLNAYCKKYLNPAVAFSETDYSGAKMTIVFESQSNSISEFKEDYRHVTTLLDNLSASPEYNDNSTVLTEMLETLRENDVDIYEDEPDSKVFEEYNFINYGYRTYKDKLQTIKEN